MSLYCFGFVLLVRMVKISNLNLRTLKILMQILNVLWFVLISKFCTFKYFKVVSLSFSIDDRPVKVLNWKVYNISHGCNNHHWYTAESLRMCKFCNNCQWDFCENFDGCSVSFDFTVLYFEGVSSSFERNAVWRPLWTIHVWRTMN